MFDLFVGLALKELKIIRVTYSATYFEPCQRSEIELFVKMVSGKKLHHRCFKGSQTNLRVLNMFKVISQHIGPMPTDAVQVSIFANFEYNQYGSLYLLLT